MKIFLFIDNWVGAQVIKYLREQKEEIIGIAIHPPEKQNYIDDIYNYSELPEDKIYTVGKEPSKKFVNILNDLKPDIILVVFWTYLLPKSIFSIPDEGCINFHMSYLPYNRGKKPNIWPILENSPAGVSLHYIDSGIDSGDILFRKEVEVKIIDTAQSLYKKQLISFTELFKESWHKIKKKNIFPIENDPTLGTFHLDKDFKKLDEINLEERYLPLDLINHLRAKTFPPFNGAYFIHEGRKVFVRIELSYEDINSTKTKRPLDPFNSEDS